MEVRMAEVSKNAETVRSIHINACVFGRRFVVTIQPRFVDLPSQEFRTFGLAEAYAQSFQTQHGWTIVDDTGGDHG